LGTPQSASEFTSVLRRWLKALRTSARKASSAARSVKKRRGLKTSTEESTAGTGLKLPAFTSISSSAEARAAVSRDKAP